MSHVEAFGELRSFVVGLEIKSRDLRKVLEESREDGKWVNGKDGTGVGERCARAIGAARAEQVTQEMVAEVAEQDKLVRQAEEIVRTDRPVEEATEKYQALMEYNQLALEDLEERLSAYGYVRPARVAVHQGKADQVRPPVVSSPARLPSGAVKACGRSMTQDGGHPGSEGGSRGGKGGDVVSPACYGAAATGGGREAKHAHIDSSCNQQQEQQQQRQHQQRRRRRREGEDISGDELGAGSASAAVVGTSDCAPGGDTSGGVDDEQGDDPSPGGAAAPTEAHRRGRDHDEREGRGEEEDIAGDDGSASDFGVATPTRPALGVHANPQPEEEPDSPPTPESPGLADWEITEGAREMLRSAQPHHEEQQAGSSSDSSSLAIAAAPRSLEALLAGNTALSATGASTDGGGHHDDEGAGGGRRSSVSSDWSPPPSTTGVRQPPRSSGGVRRQRGFVDGDDGQDGGTTGGAADGRSKSAECSDAEAAPVAEMVAAVARGGSAGVDTGSWGSSSNPPTPARMHFEEEEPSLTPAGEQSVATANGTDDRTSSLGTPSLGFRSPLKSDATADLMETALSFAERPDASAPSERAGSTTHSVISATKSSGAVPPAGGVLTGPQGGFWGAGSSPESSVAAASRETTGEVPPPASLETPATPEMLSPRFRMESDGGHGSSGNSANESRRASSGIGTGSSGGDTPSVSRRLPLTPTAVERGDNCALTANGGSGGGGDGGGRNHEGSNTGTNSEYEYDSDRCCTPELSSPLRSASISVRDLQVLTPSAKVNTSGGGCGSGDGAHNRDGDDSDELYDSDQCPTPELSSPLRSADLSAGSVGSAALCRRRLDGASGGGPLELVSAEEYTRAPKFLTIQVSRTLLNETIENLNAYAAPRLASPSELLLTVEEIMDIIDQGDLSRTLLLSAAHLKRIEMKGSRMYRIRA